MASEALRSDRPARRSTLLPSTRLHRRWAVPVQVQAGKTVDRSALKKQVVAALIDITDLSQLSRMEVQQAREEIFDLASDAIATKRIALPIAVQEVLLEDICNELLCAASRELLVLNLGRSAGHPGPPAL